MKDLQRQIDELKLTAGSGGSGGSVDLAELDKRYASKLAPELTIERIEKLERAQADIEQWQSGMSDDIQSAKNVLDDHEKGLAAAGTQLKEHAGTLEKHWAEIEALKKQITAMSSVDTSSDGQIDATALLRKIHFVEQSMAEKADKVEVREARAYTDAQVGEAEKRMESTQEQIRIEISNFREDYSLFRSKEFAALEGRVAALEKRIQGLSKSVEGIHVPEYQAPSGKTDEGLLLSIN